MKQRGVTLIELLVVIALMTIIVGAITRAYVVSLDFDQKIRDSRERDERHHQFEAKLTDLLSHAYVSADAADATTYFIAGDPTGAETTGLIDTITFTSAGSRIPGSILQSTSDFETLNQDMGPQGGVGEIGVSMTAVGDAGGKQGLFEREQRPADGDPTQGGNESVLDPDVTSIQFQFYDGLEWIQTWDTRQGQRRLPAAVQVTYQLNGDDTDHTFNVRVPLSDVTADNPLQTETGG